MIKARAFLCGPEHDPNEMKAHLKSFNESAMVQAARGSSARNEWFVELIAAQTLQAESSGSLLAKKPEIDFLLRLAGTTQISRAIRQAGATKGRPFLLVVASKTKPRVIAGLKEWELPRRKPSAGELARVEKAALLNAEKA